MYQKAKTKTEKINLFKEQKQRQKRENFKKSDSNEAEDTEEKKR